MEREQCQIFDFCLEILGSGIHGALLVLEQSFTGDTLASCLGIPSSKHIVRKHLNSEFDNLILPARFVLFSFSSHFYLILLKLCNLKSHFILIVAGKNCVMEFEIVTSPTMIDMEM